MPLDFVGTAMQHGIKPRDPENPDTFHATKEQIRSFASQIERDAVAAERMRCLSVATQPIGVDLGDPLTQRSATMAISDVVRTIAKGIREDKANAD